VITHPERYWKCFTLRVAILYIWCNLVFLVFFPDFKDFLVCINTCKLVDFLIEVVKWMWLLMASEICTVSILIKHQLVLFFHKYCYMISEDEDRFASDVVTSILRAMRYGSKDARQLFPCLLQLRGLTHLSELFHKEASIMWIKLIFSITNSTLLRIFMDSM